MHWSSGAVKFADRRTNGRPRTVERVRSTPPEVEFAAKRLRRASTPAERALWEAVRDRRLDGLKFRRQQPMGPFVLDFYCAAARSVIELDGAGHAQSDQQARDAARTAQLRAYGHRVLRFSNEQVISNLASVTETIRATCSTAAGDQR